MVSGSAEKRVQRYAKNDEQKWMAGKLCAFNTNYSSQQALGMNYFG